MKRIYTRSGDKGTTAIHGGTRVPKTDIRIEANGALDELNVWIGTARSFMDTDHKWQKTLREIQINLMALMSLVATPDQKRDANPNKLPENIVEDIESEIDRITLTVEESDYFVLPGGSRVSALLHQCRVNARRAERLLWKLNENDPVPEIILQYVNRLSDLFFIMARSESQAGQAGEERWKQFSYKRKIKPTT